MSFNASSPPGPILLLRDFLPGFSIGTPRFPLAKDAKSVVIFSWSIVRDEGTCARDFLDFGRDAGRVTSSRDAMIK